MKGLPSLENFDFVAGLYVYLADHYNGQWSREYRILSRLNVRLSDSAWAGIRRGKDDPHGEWEQARTVYRELKRKYNCKTLQ